ncbi:MAG: MauE/DoxX family redox-associated membrane protein [Sporichthyaceae bacterium]
MTSPSWLRCASPYLLAGLLTVTGTAHFLAPRPYAQIIPEQLPSPYGLVYASGVVELLCAAGLAFPRTRRATAWATAVLFVAVFPANVKMALDSTDRSLPYQVAVWTRLPIQVPLIWWAIAIARQDRPGSGA